MENRILFVDDEPSMIYAVRRALRHEPYELLTADSGEEALRVLESKKVDVIITDEMMPGMSGSDLIAAVRHRYPEVIQMLLTGQADLSMAIRAINVGEVYRFFTKPFDSVELAVHIRQALQHKALIVESRRLLRKAKLQTFVLNELEKKHPGITQVETYDDGSISIDENEGSLSIEDLIRSLRDQNQGSL